MVDFVLVHGAYSGSHVWNKVRPLLRGAGHEVYTPCLTGIGERSHLIAPQVGLSLHVRDVANAVTYEDLRGIVLVGYSYGGRVISSSLSLIGERVAHLVYLDSSVPDDGAVISTNPFPPLTSANLLQRSVDWLRPRGDQPLEAVEDPADDQWMNARRTPMPPGCFEEPVRLERPIEEYPCTRTFIKAVRNPRPAESNDVWNAADRVASSPHWRYREIDSNHSVPRNCPDELVQLLLELV